jgi:sigma-B regulation protein RsbU (phosphoserine phosphatase)
MASAKGNLQSDNKPAALQCLEIWGGNHGVSHALELPGLTGWLHSEPIQQSLQGGDVHYVSVCSKGVLTRLALADVSGHGQSAGSVAGLLRGLIRKHIDTWDQSELMRELNSSLSSRVTHSQYASAILFAYYQPTRELVFTNAGHPPASWYHSSTKTWDWLESATPLAHSIEGLPLGIIDGTDYVQVAVRLEPGDLLLLYTDGITEARDPDGEMLGKNGLLAIVRSLSIDEPARMAEHFIARLREFRGSTPPDDDHTFCLLQQSALPVVHAHEEKQ